MESRLDWFRSLSRGLKWGSISILSYWVVAILIASIPHTWFFDYQKITPVKPVEGEVITFKSHINYMTRGWYDFADKLTCWVDDERIRIGFSETSTFLRQRNEDYTATWTYRETSPTVYGRLKQECTLETIVTKKLLGIIPVTQELETTYEVSKRE